MREEYKLVITFLCGTLSDAGYCDVCTATWSSNNSVTGRAHAGSEPQWKRANCGWTLQIAKWLLKTAYEEFSNTLSLSIADHTPLHISQK